MSRAREIADRDLAATELILDADNDTSITADTDDQIDIRVGGTDTVVVTPDVLEVKGSHPDLKLLDSDDNNYGGVFYNDGTLTVGSDHGAQHSSSKARISVDGTARVTIDDGGNVDIETGDIFFSTAGKGICLGATSATAANTLHDYEEGTWTPSLTNTGSVSVNNATYTKIGKMVYVGAYLHSIGDGTAIPNNSSRFEIGGLPFTVIGSTSYHGASSVAFTASFNWDALAVDGATTLQGGTLIYFSKLAGVSTTVKNSEVQSLDQFIFGLVYLTSD